MQTWQPCMANRPAPWQGLLMIYTPVKTATNPHIIAKAKKSSMNHIFTRGLFRQNNNQINARLGNTLEH